MEMIKKATVFNKVPDTNTRTQTQFLTGVVVVFLFLKSKVITTEESQRTTGESRLVLWEMCSGLRCCQVQHSYLRTFSVLHFCATERCSILFSSQTSVFTFIELLSDGLTIARQDVSSPVIAEDLELNSLPLITKPQRPPYSSSVLFASASTKEDLFIPQSETHLVELTIF